jgi:hypothetical protein
MNIKLFISLLQKNFKLFMKRILDRWIDSDFKFDRPSCYLNFVIEQEFQLFYKQKERIKNIHQNINECYNNFSSSFSKCIIF